MSFHFVKAVEDLQRRLHESAVSQIRDSRKTDSCWILTNLCLGGIHAGPRSDPALCLFLQTLSLHRLDPLPHVPRVDGLEHNRSPYRIFQRE